MTYVMRAAGDEWEILVGDRVLGSYPTEVEAEDQLRVLYANVSRSFELTRSLDVVRVEPEKRQVWGWASSSTLGLDNKIIRHEANKNAFEEWITRGNIREMHQSVAVGKAIAWQADDEGERIFLGVRVSRGAEDTWEKVLDGTLTAFSVRGRATKHHVEIVRSRPVDIVDEIKIFEVSLVDAGGDPTSHFTNIMRAADEGSVDIDPTLVDDLRFEVIRAHGASGTTTHDHEHEHTTDGATIQHGHLHLHQGNANGAHNHGHGNLGDHVMVGEQGVSRELDEVIPAADLVERADDEASHVALAKQALDAVNSLLVKEIQETTDPEDANDGSHIGSLVEARCCLRYFLNREELEAGMTPEEITRMAKEEADEILAAADIIRAQRDTPPAPEGEDTEEEDNKDPDKEHEDEEGIARAANVAPVADPTSTAILAQLEKMNTTITGFQTELAAVKEAQETVSRAAPTDLVERLDKLGERLEEIAGQEAPAPRPITRTYPVEKLFELGDGETEVTRAAREDKVFDELRELAQTQEDLDRVNGLEARHAIKRIHGEGARPFFHNK